MSLATIEICSESLSSISAARSSSTARRRKNVAVDLIEPDPGKQLVKLLTAYNERHPRSDCLILYGVKLRGAT
jgi:hypothetical protein